MFCVIPIIWAQAGNLDPTFGNNGIVQTDLNGSYEVFSAMAIQTDGKIVVVGFSYFNSSWVTARYNPDGTLDNTFSDDGVIEDFQGDPCFAETVAIQSDGKIVVLGQCGSGYDYDFTLTRYNIDGTRDTKFGTDGEVFTDLGHVEWPWALAIQDDGKIVAVGAEGRHNYGPWNFLVIRYNPDGGLDNTFSDDGILISDWGGLAVGVAIQQDKRIVVAGMKPVGEYVAMRYNSDGTLDSSFSDDGITIINIDGYKGSAAFTIYIDPNGKILIAGQSYSDSTGLDLGILRLKNDGTLDPTFSDDGKASIDFGGDEWFPALAMQNDGKIVVAGYHRLNNLTDLALARLNNNGTLDDTFGQNGKVITDFGGNDDQGWALGIQKDNKIVVGGGTGGPTYDFVLARYLSETLVCNDPNLFCDDFSDNILDPNWNYVKPGWSEFGGFLIGQPKAKTSEAIANPIFSGCQLCNEESTLMINNTLSGKIHLFGWYYDKRNNIDLIINPQTDRIILRQRADGKIISKKKYKPSDGIDSNRSYQVKISFDGEKFEVFWDQVVSPSFILFPAIEVLPGTGGFRVENGTGFFSYIIFKDIAK